MSVEQQLGQDVAATGPTSTPAPTPEGKTGAARTEAAAGGGTAASSEGGDATGGGGDLAKQLKDLRSQIAAISKERDALEQHVAGLQKHKKKTAPLEERVADLEASLEQEREAKTKAEQAAAAKVRKLENLQAIVEAVPSAHSKRVRLIVKGMADDGLDLTAEDREATLSKALKRLESEAPDLLKEPETVRSTPAIGRVSNGQAVLPAGAGGVVRDGQRYL